MKVVVKYRHQYAWGKTPWEYIEFPDAANDSIIESELMGMNNSVPFVGKYRGVEFIRLSGASVAYELNRYRRDNQLLETKLKMCRDTIDLIHTYMDRLDIPEGMTLDRISDLYEKVKDKE